MAKEKNNTGLPPATDGDLTALLISIREEAGYSLTQMADALCLSEQVITNLENEDFDQLADPPYIRGYLRNYAKLGEQDPTELIGLYESLRGADASELDFSIKVSNKVHTLSHRRLSPIMGQLLLLAILLIGIGSLSMIPSVNKWIKNTLVSLSTQFASPTGESNPDLIGSLPVPIPLPTDDEITGSDKDNTSTTTLENNAKKQIKQTSQSDSEEQVENKPVNDTASSDNSESTNTDSSDTSESTNDDSDESIDTVQQTIEKPNETEEPTENINTKQVSIKLVFNKEVWMRIRNKEGKTIFEGINKSGTDKSLQFEKPITFRVGNAQGLSLFVDDKPVDISQYTNGSIANFTLE